MTMEARRGVLAVAGAQQQHSTFVERPSVTASTSALRCEPLTGPTVMASGLMPTCHLPSRMEAIGGLQWNLSPAISKMTVLPVFAGDPSTRLITGSPKSRATAAVAGRL